jgi:hypothetical protein
MRKPKFLAFQTVSEFTLKIHQFMLTTASRDAYFVGI